jgi:plastocyanin
VFYRGRAPVAVPVPASDCLPGDASVAENPFSRSTDFALGGVAVWVSNPVSNRPVPREPTVVRLRHCRFEPSRLAVAAGSRLRFVNEDPLVHSLVSTAESNPKLDAGLPFPGMSADLVLPAAELGVRVGSRRFPGMIATVAVVNSAWSSITEEDGAAILPDPPAGTLSISAWHPELGTVRVDVEVPEAGDVPLTIEFPESALADESTRRSQAVRPVAR